MRAVASRSVRSVARLPGQSMGVGGESAAASRRVRRGGARERRQLEPIIRLLHLVEVRQDPTHLLARGTCRGPAAASEARTSPLRPPRAPAQAHPARGRVAGRRVRSRRRRRRRGCAPPPREGSERGVSRGVSGDHRVSLSPRGVTERCVSLMRLGESRRMSGSGPRAAESTRGSGTASPQELPAPQTAAAPPQPASPPPGSRASSPPPLAQLPTAADRTKDASRTRTGSNRKALVFPPARAPPASTPTAPRPRRPPRASAASRLSARRTCGSGAQAPVRAPGKAEGGAGGER